MRKTLIAVRDVDEETFGKFKAFTVEERMKLGIALTLAMRLWLEENRKKHNKRVKFPKIRPFRWGKGTEKISNEIDKILYETQK